MGQEGTVPADTSGRLAQTDRSQMGAGEGAGQHTSFNTLARALASATWQTAQRLGKKHRSQTHNLMGYPKEFTQKLLELTRIEQGHKT